MSGQEFKIGDTVKVIHSGDICKITKVETRTFYGLDNGDTVRLSEELKYIEPPVTEADLDTFIAYYWSNKYKTTHEVLKALYEAVKKRGIA